MTARIHPVGATGPSNASGLVAGTCAKAAWAADTDPSAPPAHVLTPYTSTPPARVRSTVDLVRTGRENAPARDVARLLVLAGLRAGAEIGLDAAEVTLGRGTDCRMVLPDISVSRLHALVRREGNRYAIVDRASGNGTRVNGRRIRRARLSDGDEIALGDTLLRFVDPRRRAAGSALYRRWRATAAAAAIVAFALALAVWPTRNSPGAARRAGGTKARVAPRSTAGGEVDPASARSGARGPASETIRREREHVSAQESEGEGVHGGSLAPIDGARSGGTVSTERPAAGEPRRSTSALPSREPARLAPEAAGDIQPVEAGSRRRPGRKGAVPPLWREPGGAAAIAAYLTGDVSAALELARSAPETFRELQAFDVALREAQAKAESREPLEAIAALERADAVDRALAGERTGSSRPGQEVRRMLADLHVEAALQLGNADNRLASAAAHLRAALAYDARNEAVRRRLEEAAERARELYLRGYVAKDSDPDAARHAFRVAAAALPAEDETAQKARRWIERLEARRKGGVEIAAAGDRAR